MNTAGRSPYVVQIFTQGACITDNIKVWEMVITVTTAIYLLIEVHQACSEVSSVTLFLLLLNQLVLSISRESRPLHIITDKVEEGKQRETKQNEDIRFLATAL